MIQIEPGKLYLITGISGFLGERLAKRLLEQGAKVRGVSRNEGKLIELKEKYPSVEYITGDVSEYSVCYMAMKDVSGVFHLAAFKHVGLAEVQAKECIKSNVVGSLNVLDISLQSPQCEFVIGVSTDKAAQVAGVYGATKFLMESLFQNYEKMNDKCKYRLVRYGNVLYSTGSVLCKWKKALQEGKEVIITDPKATRFYWTVDQAIELIFNCLENATDSKPFVPGMKSVSLEDLLTAMTMKYAVWTFKNSSDISEPLSEVRYIGLQKGENLHEKILEDGPDSSQVERYTMKEIMELI